MKLALILVVLAAGSVVLWREVKRESGLLWMSQAESARLFTRHFGPEVFEHFHRDVSRYPSSEEGFSVLLHAPEKEAARWKGPYLEGPTIPRDPWGREYHYRASSREKKFAFEVFSLGPDGIISGDDIGNFSR